jgi:hypothetical protein
MIRWVKRVGREGGEEERRGKGDREGGGEMEKKETGAKKGREE